MLILTTEYHLAMKNKWNPAIWDNMYKLWKYYAKWNKSDGKRQILSYFTICGIKAKQSKRTNKIKQNKLIDTENKLVVTRGEGDHAGAEMDKEEIQNKTPTA